ncbi:MAG: hypothetical protein ACOC3D_00065 [Pseudomonadota bacterium]
MPHDLDHREGKPAPHGRLAAQLLGPIRLRTCDGIPWSPEREAAAGAAQARLWELVGTAVRERRRRTTDEAGTG